MIAKSGNGDSSDDVRREGENGKVRLTLPGRGLLERSDVKTKRDLVTFISTELAFKSGWGIRYAFFCGGKF
jgi:hypothetical protein